MIGQMIMNNEVSTDDRNITMKS